MKSLLDLDKKKQKRSLEEKKPYTSRADAVTFYDHVIIWYSKGVEIHRERKDDVSSLTPQQRYRLKKKMEKEQVK